MSGRVPFPAAPTTRDTRIDVLRALALMTIFIDHVPGNVYEHYTMRNFGVADATEAFVLLSGIAAGIAYGARFKPGSRMAMAVKAVRRACSLYVAHVMTTIVAIALFAGASIWFARPDLLEKINIGPVFTETPEALLGIVTLGHQIGYNNILTMYAGIMLMVPALLILSRIGIGLMLAVSGMVWLLAGLYKVAPLHYPNDGMWFLNPLSWQFLFAIGMAATLHLRRGGTIPYHRGLLALAIGYLVMSWLWVEIPLWGWEKTVPLPFVLGDFNKTFLTLPRLLNILALAYVFVSVPVFSRLTRLSESHPLAVMGRHGLAIFVAGTVLAMVGQIIGELMETDFAIDTLVLGSGIALQFALAYFYEWEKNLNARAKRAGQPAEAPRPATVPTIPAREPAPRNVA